MEKIYVLSKMDDISVYESTEVLFASKDKDKLEAKKVELETAPDRSMRYVFFIDEVAEI